MTKLCLQESRLTMTALSEQSSSMCLSICLICALTLYLLAAFYITCPDEGVGLSNATGCSLDSPAQPAWERSVGGFAPMAMAGTNHLAGLAGFLQSRTRMTSVMTRQ